MKYLSCFSGIGGLEASNPPILFCEQDAEASSILKAMHPGIEVFPDICKLRPPPVDIIAGGWPCQDISIAGKQEGLAGLRSGLLRELLRVADEAQATIVVAENVTNLLRMNDGAEFTATLEEFTKGNRYPYVGWRVLNAREFGLPQNRSRLLIIAAKDQSFVHTLFRDIEPQRKVVKCSSEDIAAGFYWTAGTHSINYTRGYVPTIKIGSSLGIASPPAVHYGDVVRMLTADEALRLQGFCLTVNDFSSRAAAYKAAGNAVARDIGRWTLDGLALAGSTPGPTIVPKQINLLSYDSPIDKYPVAGMFRAGAVVPVAVKVCPRANNLSDYLNLDSVERLSSRAANGLLVRLIRSQTPCPEDLLATLRSLAPKEVA